MSDIHTSHPPDPAVAAELVQIRLNTESTQGSTQSVRNVLGELLEAIKEITKR